MLNFILRRLLYLPISLLIVVSVAFFVLRLTGDTVHLYVDLNATPEQEELVRQQLGLDRPLVVQYFWFVGTSCGATSASPSSIRCPRSTLSSGASA